MTSTLREDLASCQVGDLILYENVSGYSDFASGHDVVVHFRRARQSFSSFRKEPLLIDEPPLMQGPDVWVFMRGHWQAINKRYPAWERVS